MSERKPKINVRMEHVTRRADRRGPARAGKGRRQAEEEKPESSLQSHLRTYQALVSKEKK